MVNDSGMVENGAIVSDSGLVKNDAMVNNSGSLDETKYMRYALELAEKGVGHVNPNPMVGAVIVKDGQIIGAGYHEKYANPHAERRAIESCTESPVGSTIYVTLEPCCHYGKTPPCTEAIIQSGISKVVIGSQDPNQLIAGKGIKILQDAGIEVVVGILKEECDSLNQAFFHYIQTKTPYLVMKYAMTMDGKIATSTGESKWITGKSARHRVHEDRHRYSAIMVGIGTVLTDDPLLTCRLENGKNPIRIIADTNLRTPLDSRIVATAREVPTIIATSASDSVSDLAGQEPYLAAGCRVVHISEKDGYLDLSELMKKLGEYEIDSILLEGGGALNWSALNAGIVNKVQAYIAPKIFGGVASKSPVGGIGVASPQDGFLLRNSRVEYFDGDILIESEVENNVHRNR